MKKILAICFLIILVPLILTGCSSSSPERDFAVKHNNVSGVDVTSYNGNDEIVKIPSSFDKKDIWTVTGFKDNKDIKEVTVPNAWRIGDEAFRNCTSLTKVVLGDNIKYIDEFAFAGCTSLSEINLPSQLKEIGKNAFYNCSGLHDIVIPSSVEKIGSYAFSLSSSIDQFNYGISIKDKTIPGNVKSIGSYAFAGCSNYKLIIEEGVKSIGAHAFGETSSLRYVELPESLTFIGEKAFCPWYRDPSDITLKVHRNSYAEEYAKQNGYKIEYFE